MRSTSDTRRNILGPPHSTQILSRVMGLNQRSKIDEGVGRRFPRRGVEHEPAPRSDRICCGCINLNVLAVTLGPIQDTDMYMYMISVCGVGSTLTDHRIGWEEQLVGVACTICTIRATMMIWDSRLSDIQPCSSSLQVRKEGKQQTWEVLQ